MATHENQSIWYNLKEMLSDKHYSLVNIKYGSRFLSKKIQLQRKEDISLAVVVNWWFNAAQNTNTSKTINISWPCRTGFIIIKLTNSTDGSSYHLFWYQTHWNKTNFAVQMVKCLTYVSLQQKEKKKRLTYV